MPQLAQLKRFLTPKALRWTSSRVYELVADRLTGAPPRVERVRKFVEEYAKEGDPQDVLRAMDRFARDKRFLMNVGPEKGPLMAKLIGRLPASARVLELGAYCGYSAIMIADHWKDLYERDLRLIEELGLLRAGSTIVADNVGELFGADAYLEYVRTCGRYSSENRPAHIEYSDLPDAVEISIYQGQS